MSRFEAQWVKIELAGEGAFWAQPGSPDDDGRLAELVKRGSATIALANDEGDVIGHASSADVTLDVEGHAVTIRMRSPADAAQLRRRLAVGAVAATIVAGGAAAAMSGVNPWAAPEAPAAPVNPAAPVTERGTQRTINDPYMVDVVEPAAPAAPAVNEVAPASGTEITPSRDDRSFPRPGQRPEPR